MRQEGFVLQLEMFSRGPCTESALMIAMMDNITCAEHQKLASHINNELSPHCSVA